MLRGMKSLIFHRTDLIFDRYVDDIRKSQQNLNDSLYWYIQNYMEIIDDSFDVYRKEDSQLYPLNVLLMVIMINDRQTVWLSECSEYS